MTRTARALLLAAVGGQGVVMQIALIREHMAVFAGNELTAALVVSMWVLCEAAGAWCCGWALRAGVRTESALSVLVPAGAVFAVGSVLAVIAGRPLLGVLPGELAGIPLLVLASVTNVLLPAAAHGSLFVAAAAMPAGGAENRRVLGSAYLWEGLGSAAGGMLAAMLLVDRLPAPALVAAFSLPVALLAAALPGSPALGRVGAALAATGLVAVSVQASGIERQAWSRCWPGWAVTRVANSRYGAVLTLERQGQLMVLYDGMPVATAPASDPARAEELVHLPLLIHPGPSRVLLLGSALGSYAEVLRQHVGLHATLVERDPLLARATALLTGPAGAGMEVVTADPLTFLATTRDRYDCIIVTADAPASLGSSVLYTTDFYRRCAGCLAPGGLLAVPAPGPVDPMSDDVRDIVLTRVASLSRAFRCVRTFAADFPLLLAAQQPVVADPAALYHRLAVLRPHPVVLDSAYLHALLNPLRQTLLTARLAGVVGVVRPDTRLQPREFLLGLIRATRPGSQTLARWYARLASTPPWVIPALVALLIAPATVLGRRRSRAVHRKLSVFTSGFTSAAVSALAIFGYQIQNGTAYVGTGVLVALFMFGTAAGGYAGALVAGPRASRLFATADVGLGLLPALVLLATLGRSPVAFHAIQLLCGFGVGFQYPVAGDAHRGSARSTLLGALTALDLLGGFLGGALTTLALMPAFGLVVAAAVAVGAKALSTAVLLAAPGSAD